MGTKKREVAKFDGESDQLGLSVSLRDALWRDLKGL
jgi:hypothetical protein